MTALGDLADEAGLAPVTAAWEGVLGRYAAVYHKHHALPRFFLSPTYLAARPSTYLRGYLDGCVVLLKRSAIMGNYAMYLVVPPMHGAGDAAAERAVLERFRALGVGALLSLDDRLRYGYPEAAVAPRPNMSEYVYDTHEYAVPVGAGHRNTRAALNRAARLEADGVVTIRQSPVPDAVALERLARLWHAQTGRHRAEAALVRTFAAHAATGSLRRWSVVVTHHGRPLAHSLTEEVAPGQVIIVSRLRNYVDSVLPDPTLLLHALDSAHWHRVVPGAWLTIGAAVGSRGLALHKEKLRPVARLPLGRLTTPPGLRIAKEDYDDVSASLVHVVPVPRYAITQEML